MKYNHWHVKCKHGQTYEPYNVYFSEDLQLENAILVGLASKIRRANNRRDQYLQMNDWRRANLIQRNMTHASFYLRCVIRWMYRYAFDESICNTRRRIVLDMADGLLNLITF